MLSPRITADGSRPRVCRRFFHPRAAPSESSPPGAPRGGYDVAIVGAGVSGLYAALRLVRGAAASPLRVLLLERQSRAGGRVVTEQVHGHTLEYGPMRFEETLQPAFARLVRDELALPLTRFPPYTCSAERPDFNLISFEEVQAIVTSDLAPPFALLKHGLAAVLGAQWDLARDNVGDASRPARKAWLRRHGTFQGRPLHAHGLWDTLAHVLSKPALDWLQQKGACMRELRAFGCCHCFACKDSPRLLRLQAAFTTSST